MLTEIEFQFDESFVGFFLAEDDDLWGVSGDGTVIYWNASPSVNLIYSSDDYFYPVHTPTEQTRYNRKIRGVGKYTRQNHSEGLGAPMRSYWPWSIQETDKYW